MDHDTTLPDGLAEQLRSGESAGVEFKSTLSDSRAIVQTIAAMATVGGGVVLVGVRPDGTPVGYSPGEGELERLVQRVLAGTDPKIHVDVDRPLVQGRRLLRIRVPPGDGPHLAHGRAYYRSGPATVTMTRDEYERRLLDRLRESAGFERRFERGVRHRDLSQAAIQAFRAHAGAAGREMEGDDLAILQRLHLISGDDVRVAGLLLFGEQPQGPFPQATIRALTTRGATQDSQAIEGTLFDQVDAAEAFVARNLRVRPVRTGLRREEVPELPRAAVREVLVNAIAHRDYRSTAAIQLRLGDEGLEVWNPGHLPPPLTPAALRQPHPSIPTNPLIARTMFRAGYLEEWGNGTIRIAEAMTEHGNPDPTFEDDIMGGIRVRLPFPGSIPDDLHPRIAHALARRARGIRFTTADYAGEAGIARRTAQLDLNELESRGLVRREGTGRSSRWVWS